MTNKGTMALLVAAIVLAIGHSASVSGELLHEVDTLTDQELSELRGGFMLGDLEIAIGLEQIVSVDGATLVVSRLSIPNLNQRVSGQGLAHDFETVLTRVGHLQREQAVISTATGAGSLMTLIQNSLNGSVIQNVRQLDIELNNLGSAYRVPRDFSEPFFPFPDR